jgi:hypothetical protein
MKSNKESLEQAEGTECLMDFDPTGGKFVRICVPILSKMLSVTGADVQDTRMKFVNDLQHKES